jgi:hypothetical protein
MSHCLKGINRIKIRPLPYVTHFDDAAPGPAAMPAPPPKRPALDAAADQHEALVPVPVPALVEKRTGEVPNAGEPSKRVHTFKRLGAW